MRTATSISIILGAALAASPAAAQDGGQGKEVGEVVVTAARTILPANALPLTVDVIGKSALDQQVAIGGSIVDAVAALTPSFSPTRQKLSGAGETLRGRSPLYAINGIPQSTPLRDGSRDGFTIDPFFIDRVEVIFGSNALQGIGGTGGIVNQVTVGAPKDEGFSGRTLLQTLADNGFHGDGAGYKAAGLGSWKTGAFDATLGAAYETRGAYYDGHGKRVGFDAAQGETQDSKSWSLFGRFGYAVTETARVDLILSRFELEGDGDYLNVIGNRTTGVPSTSIRGKQPGTPARGRTESVSVSYTDTDLAGGNLVTQAFFNRSKDLFGGDSSATFQDIRIAPLGTLLDQSENRSRKLGAKFSYERAVPGLENLTATVGLDLLKDRTVQALVRTDRVWVPPTDYRSIAPFAQANLALFDKKLRIAGGLRNENVQIKVDDFTTLAFYGSRAVGGGSPEFHDTLFNGGVIFEPTPGIRGYVSYAQGYTVPDVGRITRSININGVDLDDYLDISPIVSNNREVGLEFKRGWIDASASYFWSTSTRGQLLVLVGTVFEVQRQRVEIEGLELNATVRTPVEGLTFQGGYAHLKGRADSNADGRVDIDLDGANISPDRIVLAANYNRGPWSSRLQVGKYIARDFDGADPRNSFEGYTLVDGSIRYQTENWGGLNLAVQNLLDEYYVDYNTDTQQPTNNARFFSGRGRTFTLGWDYRF
ncbi:MAG: TonB-dependent receptor [Alphaproteobacteria bacterium]|nr:TonB-dependent receptor [Alphaproteobacteria bacterium]MBU1514122.1 TonB-dependent receptor [Alphaproteobacteria bacterium]MBU2096229.1 TonB-dependent receptor [Alphaproteobacteria bacterium]MBU2151183.1 TonB-dependent receptor [Alphaproteobacteria bacterium]MBU2307158.1 TonB-dependent receptor [Alphaproteobacteria bacterium]